MNEITYEKEQLIEQLLEQMDKVQKVWRKKYTK